jgi:hypothetical protein
MCVNCFDVVVWLASVGRSGDRIMRGGMASYCMVGMAGAGGAGGVAGVGLCGAAGLAYMWLKAIL